MEFNVEIQPNNLEAGLKSDVEDFESNFVRKVVRLLPVEIRFLMDDSTPSGKLYERAGNEGFTRFHQASAEGQVPAKDTNELYDSLKGRMTSESAGELELSDEAQYLDPLFGGYLNRPFIEKGLDRAIGRALAE